MYGIATCLYGIAIDKDRLHSRGGGLRGGVKTTGTIDSSATVPPFLQPCQRRRSSECLPSAQYDDLKRSPRFHMLKTKQRSLSPSVPMTEGSLWRNILIFSLPLMLSQILQVLFTMADVAIVGKFSSSNAMGSVGSTSILVTLFTGFLIGMGAGVNVRVAQLLGAKRQEDTEKAVHTALLLCVLTGVIISGLCIFSAEWMLRLIRTRDDLLEGAELYFRIYALGMPAMGVFNFGNGVMSANGDTRRPLMYLLTAGILNVIMNLFFVIVCNMAEDGVALSSIISQYITAVLILVHMFRDKSACGLRLRSIRFWRGCSVPILVLGIPAGIQNAIFAVANLFIQRSVNYFDTVMVNGNSAASNADTLIYNMMSAFYTACSTFMGQNFGAGRHDRVMKSYFVSLTYSFAAAAVAGVLLRVFGREFLLLFTNEQAVVDAGMQKVSVMWWSFAISAFMDCTIAASRGLGKSFAPTVIVIMGSCVFRVAWVYTVFEHFHTIPSLYLLYSCSWTITAVAEIVYFVIVCRRLRGGKTAEVQSV